MNGSQLPVVSGPWLRVSGVRCRVSEDRGQITEDRGQGSESVVRMQILSINKAITEITFFCFL
jgi:hypothetical protein